MKRRDILRALAALPVLAPHARLLARPEQAGASAPINLHISVAGKLPDPAHVGRVVAAGPPASVLVYCLAPHTLSGWPFQLAPAAGRWFFLAVSWPSGRSGQYLVPGKPAGLEARYGRGYR